MLLPSFVEVCFPSRISCGAAELRVRILVLLVSRFYIYSPKIIPPPPLFPFGGRILDTQTFRAAGVFRILPTHTFSGCRHICILPTQTFRVAGGFAFYLHTLSTTPRALLLKNPMKSLTKVCYILKTFSRCARGLLLMNP